MQDTVLATRRLRLVPFMPDDLDELKTLHADPEVNAHLDIGRRFAERVPDDIWLASRLVDYVTSHALQGFGMWKVLAKDGTFIGRAGFEPHEPTSEISMEIVIGRSHWGQGFASELSPALVNWFFLNTYYSHLICLVARGNAAARKVLHRAGLSWRETRWSAGRPCDAYQILNPSLRRLVANG